MRECAELRRIQRPYLERLGGDAPKPNPTGRRNNAGHASAPLANKAPASSGGFDPTRRPSREGSNRVAADGATAVVARSSP